LKVLVLGAGNIGRVIAHDIIKCRGIDGLAIADKDESRVAYVVSLLGGNVEHIILDASKYDSLLNIFGRYELIVSALPGRYGFNAVKAAINVGVDIVDVSYMPEDIFKLSDEAYSSRVRVIPDAGVAPGLSNIIIGHAVSMLDAANVINVYVGGLPIEPLPPLGYVVTWSVEDLISEYTRRPKIVVGGKVIVVDALSGLEEVSFPGLGVLEAFYTDGLRTLLHTIKDVNIMWEKTLRYPGHVKGIRLLRDLGLFDNEPIEGVVPRDLLARVLENSLRKPGFPVLLAMKIYVEGESDGKTVSYTFLLVEMGINESGFTAMARTTGYTASILAQLIIEGYIDSYGIIPPEIVGMDRVLYREFINRIRSKNIEIKEIYEDA